MRFRMARLICILFGAILFNSLSIESLSGGKSKATSSATSTKPLKCGDNEILDKCPVDCPSDYCPKSRDADRSKCPKPKKCPPAACKSCFNSRRAANNTYIPTKRCRKCHLPGRRPVLECKPACRCKKNYWRLNGECVSYAQCQYAGAKEKLKRSNVRATGKFLYERLSKYPNESYSILSLQLLSTIVHLVEFADDEVSEKIMEFLDIDNKEELNRVVSDTVAKIQSDKVGHTRFSLKAYGDSHEEFTDDFKENFQDVDHGELELVDYERPKKAVRKINKWFHDKSSFHVDNVATTEMFDDPMGVVYTTSLDFVYSLDHEANPACISEIDFRVNPGKTLKFPSLSGIGYFKYAELEDLDARLIVLHIKGGDYVCIFCPNDPNNLVELVRKNQDPEVFYGSIERAQWMCLDVHLTIGYADVTNELLELIPELKLHEKDFTNVFKSGKSVRVNGIYQQLHLHLDRKTREAPVNSELCPDDDDLPFVKIDSPFAYYVVDPEWMIFYAGALLGPQSYGLEFSNPP